MIDNKKLYRLTPLFREKIWGGHRLHDVYGYDTGCDKAGEAWVVTSLAGNEDSPVVGTGLTLSQLYQSHRELFGIDAPICPIRATVIDAGDDLSVQCHPSDAYAMAHEHSLGKPEAWYVLAVDPGARIEFGHKAKDKDELRTMIMAGQWDRLLNYVQPAPGDFLFVPDSTMHAIGKGTMVFEVSRNADLTYRVYDYDRRDAQGRKRQLHVQQSLAVLKAPSTGQGLIHPDAVAAGGLAVTTYHDVAGEFTLRRLQCRETGSWQPAGFAFMFISEGKGTLDGQPVSKGQTWLVPCGHGPLAITGPLDILEASYRAV